LKRQTIDDSSAQGEWHVHRTRKWSFVGFFVLVCVAPGCSTEGHVLSRSGDWCCPWTTTVEPGPTVSAAPETPTQPKPAESAAPSEAAREAARDNAFAQAPAAGTEAESLGNPNMLGDFIRGFVSRQVGSVLVNVAPQGFPKAILVSVPIIARIPEASGSGMKIAENESPRPQDRVFLTYNYYDNILPSINGNSGLSSINLHVETLGGEVTFLNGDASLGIRVPVYQLVGADQIDQERLDDVSVIAKSAWINDGPDGSVFSTGLMVTLPTSQTTLGLNGERLNSTIFQPFAGAIVQLGARTYLHGFSSVAVPTDSRDATFLFNDIGLGYWLYRDSDGDWLTGVVPTIEAHANTPLNRRGSTKDPVGALESIVLTEGVHLFFGQSVLQIGLATPVTGPRPFDVEAIAQLNFRY
jgi:hypothetical protein